MKNQNLNTLAFPLGEFQIVSSLCKTCHSRESGNPAIIRTLSRGIPACAGMTENGAEK